MKNYKNWSITARRLLITAVALPFFALMVAFTNAGWWVHINRDECSGCGSCVEADPSGAFYLESDGKVMIIYDRLTPDGVEAAAAACPNDVITYGN